MLGPAIMPPRTGALTSSFSVTDVNNEVRRACLAHSSPSADFAAGRLSAAESGWLPVQKTVPRREYLPVPYRSLTVLCSAVLTVSCSTGEAIPLHAGAHPPCPPRILHP